MILTKLADISISYNQKDAMTESFIGLNNVVFTITYKSQRADNILNIEWHYNWTEAVEADFPDYLKNRVKIIKQSFNKGYCDKTYEINVAELKRTDNEIVCELVSLHKSGIIMSQQKDAQIKAVKDWDRDTHRWEGAFFTIGIICLIGCIMALFGMRLTIKP